MVKNSIYIILLSAMLLVAGCRSQKQIVAPSVTTNIEQIRALPSLSEHLLGISAKMRLSAGVSGKNLSSSGAIKIKPGEGISLSITPLGIFEAARVEFLPSYMQYINRLESEFAQVGYATLAPIEKLGLGYPLLESVLLNNIYIPSDISRDDFLSALVVTREGDSLLLEYRDKEITYKYYIDETTGHLVKSVGEHREGVLITCLYGNFSNVSGQEMPLHIELQLGGTGKSVNLILTLNNPKELTAFKPTTPSSSYKRVAEADLLKILGGK